MYPAWCRHDIGNAAADRRLMSPVRLGQSLHLAPFAGERTSIRQVERGGDIKDAAVALRVTRFRDRAHTQGWAFICKL